MTLVQFALVSVFPAGVIAAALTDATSYTIPNRLSAFLAAAYIPAALAMGVPPLSLAVSLGVGVAGLVVGIVMFALRWIGGGDAKLLAACTLWLGFGAIVPFLLWTAIAGGALSLGLISLRKLPVPLDAMGPAWFGRLMKPGGDIPYGVAIAAGALAALPHASMLSRAHGA